MAKTVADRIATLKAKREKLAHRLAKLEASEKSTARKQDTRRKIIVGGAVLVEMKRDAAFAESIQSLLGVSVGRLKDRQTIADLLPAPPAAER
jgi:vacuolar-type H+-ATPase subunit D/Vma8